MSVVIGIRKSDGRKTICRAKPENRGRGSCTHFADSHEEVSEEQWQHIQEEQLAQGAGEPQGLHRPAKNTGYANGLLRRDADKEDALYKRLWEDCSGDAYPDITEKNIRKLTDEVLGSYDIRIAGINRELSQDAMDMDSERRREEPLDKILLTEAERRADAIDDKIWEVDHAAAPDLIHSMRGRDINLVKYPFDDDVRRKIEKAQSYWHTSRIVGVKDDNAYIQSGPDKRQLVVPVGRFDVERMRKDYQIGLLAQQKKINEARLELMGHNGSCVSAQDLRRAYNNGAFGDKFLDAVPEGGNETNGRRIEDAMSRREAADRAHGEKRDRLTSMRNHLENARNERAAAIRKEIPEVMSFLDDRRSAVRDLEAMHDPTPENLASWNKQSAAIVHAYGSDIDLIGANKNYYLIRSHSNKHYQMSDDGGEFSRGDTTLVRAINRHTLHAAKKAFGSSGDRIYDEDVLHGDDGHGLTLNGKFEHMTGHRSVILGHFM